MSDLRVFERISNAPWSWGHWIRAWELAWDLCDVTPLYPKGQEETEV